MFAIFLRTQSDICRMNLRNIKIPFLSKRSTASNNYTEQQLQQAWAAAMGSSEDLVTVRSSSEALKLSAYFLGIRLLSEIPAALPLEVVTLDKDGNRSVDNDHFLKRLLDYPNTYQTAYTQREYLFQCLALHGNAIGVKQMDANTGSVTNIIMVDPRSVTNLTLSQGTLIYDIDDTNTGIKGRFLGDDIIHVKQFAGNGVWGRDPLTYARENLGLSLATERFGNTWFNNKGNLKSVIEFENSMKDEAYETFKKRWNNTADHETKILEFGGKYKQLGVTPDTAQFIKSREVGVQDIARWLNIPPHMLKDLSRATFSNIEHQDIQFAKYTLRSLLRNVEQELEFKLVFPANRGKVKLRFNLNNILRGDIKTRSYYYHLMVTDGIMTRNEVRRLENMKPLDGLDDPLTPAHIVGKQTEIKEPGSEGDEGNKD